MKLQEKGTFEYLKRKKNQNLLIMLISFAVVFAVFFAGLAVFKSRNNYCTLIATVLVLPAAKFAVAYFVLLPHKSATQAQKEAVEAAAGALTCCYDCVFSNSKSPKILSVSLGFHHFVVFSFGKHNNIFVLGS